MKLFFYFLCPDPFPVAWAFCNNSPFDSDIVGNWIKA
jgi:hypothetical protein